jgi:hypothetical protein
VTYSAWDRERAALTNLCFEVYIPHLTDRPDGDPADLDVWVQAPFKFPARYIKRHGNNWVYAVSLKDLDPLSRGISASGNTLTEIALQVRAISTRFNYTPALSAPISVRFE